MIQKLPPRLTILVELEEHPRVRVFAETAEDEQRLRLWLCHPATGRSLAAAVADALEEAA